MIKVLQPEEGWDFFWTSHVYMQEYCENFSYLAGVWLRFYYLFPIKQRMYEYFFYFCLPTRHICILD